jgi:hypothetical protein
MDEGHSVKVNVEEVEFFVNVLELGANETPDVTVEPNDCEYKIGVTMIAPEDVDNGNEATVMVNVFFPENAPEVP